MNFSHIFLKYDKNNIKELTNVTYSSEFIANFPYIKGIPEYFEYINTNFFDDLLEKDICHIINFTKHDINVKYDSFGYACDSNSKYFLDKLNDNFPDLILYNHELNKNFSLSKSDLFAFNTINPTDNNLYS